MVSSRSISSVRGSGFTGEPLRAPRLQRRAGGAASRPEPLGGRMLRGRTAVITGASRGLGAGLARAFRERGLRLGLCARTEPVLAGDPEVVSARLDVRDAAALAEFAAAVEARFGAIDLWINNAGVLEPI